MPLTVTKVTLPATGAGVAIVFDGSQDWQVMLPGFDNGGVATLASVLNPFPVQIGDGTHAMPTGDTQARAINVIPGDGTHATPAGDIAARGVQVIPSDGTNATPAGDVAARARFGKLTDGTSTAAIKAASTPAIATDPALVVALSPNGAAVKLTDGTNFAPTGDTAARSGFERITDGTNTAAVKAASTAPLATDPAIVVALSPNTPQLPATLGSKTSANSLPVVIASDQASVPVTGIGTAAAAADSVANPTLGLLQSLPSLWNGATWDRARGGLVGVQTSPTGWANVLSMGRYNATPLALSDTNFAPMQVTSTGALKTVQADMQTAVLDLSATPSNSASTTTVGSTISGLSKASAFTIIAKNQGSTGGTLDLTLQDSPDGGTTWFDFWHLPQLAAAAVSNVLAYVPGINDAVTTIGQGTAGTPGVLLAAGAKRGGHPFDAMRLVMTTGSGVSASVAQTVKVYVTQPTP